MTYKPIGIDDVNRLFIYSMMIVKDEVNNFKKYSYLKLVEFYEFVCRVAIHCIEVKDTIEVKVHAVLGLFFDNHNNL